MKVSFLGQFATTLLLLGFVPVGMAQAPTWKVHLEIASGWTDPTGITVDSKGNAVTLESNRELKMPLCARLNDAALSRASKRVAWISKNLTPGKDDWSGQCYDDPQAKVSIHDGTSHLFFRYPLLQECRDAKQEPPLALRELVDALLELREKASGRCVPEQRKGQ